MNATLFAIFAYLVGQLLLGAWISRRIGTEADYLVAGRKLGYGLATFSLFATWFGAETIVSGAGRAYERGFSLASPEPFGYGLCLVGMGVVFAAPLWRRQLTTLADLFRQRYSVGVERIAAIILIPSSVLWAAAQVRAFGHVVHTVAPDIPLEAAVAVAAGFTILYTMFGGLLADAMTDLVQGLVVCVGLVLLSLLVLDAIGGVGGVQAALASTPRAVAPAGAGDSWLDIAEAWSIPLLGSVVATELVGRIVGTRSATVARRSSLMAAALYVGVGLMPMFVGLVGGAIVSVPSDAEQLVPLVAQRLMPGLLYAVFAGALISAILSTVDSTLLVASGILSHNIIVPLAGVRTERQKVRIARAGVMSFGVLAWLLAHGADGVFELVEQASAFGSAGVLVTVCFGLFTSWGGPRAALSTLLAGVLAYLAGVLAQLPAPFLLSVSVSLVTYIGVATVEQSRELRTR